MTRALCVGECMVEVRHVDASTARIGHAGDTYNTAAYLRRTADQLGVDLEVGYLTGLGSDEDSADMRAAWAAERVMDRSVLLEGLLPGLYTVRVDDHGERRFSYWRSASAARHLFATTEWVEQFDAEVVHLSGITLQLTSPAAREALRHRLAELRSAGAVVSFDTNYRPSGWSDPRDAARVMDEVSNVSSIVFATFEDEVAMHGCPSVPAAAARLAGLGVPEVVVKSGADGAHILTGGRAEHVPASPVDRVVDTTAAGDAFAGGYLAARVGGLPATDAGRIAAEVAATVVSHPGAIIPRSVPLVSSRLATSPHGGNT
jgi:2-dehydro-3-deoxygluconokinase